MLDDADIVGRVKSFCTTTDGEPIVVEVKLLDLTAKQALGDRRLVWRSIAYFDEPTEVA